MSEEKRTKKSLLERLREGIVIGDGGYVVALEKRGYVKAGPYTPEAVIENPDAVRQLHREFLRAGSDILQAFTFYSSDDKLKYKGNLSDQEVTCELITRKGCEIALEEAEKEGALVAGNISQNPAFLEGKEKSYIQKEIKKQVDIFVQYKVDFIICEFFTNVEEMEWTLEEAVKGGLPVVSTMCVGKLGDDNGVSSGECAIRMAKAGAHVVGVNCFFDPVMTIETIKEMKAALDSSGLKPFLITQPNGFFTTGMGRGGYCECPEYPLAMESRVVTRFDVHRYARDAFNAGVRYIGGCCGFEAYHIRAIAEELAPERGFLPKASDKHEPWGACLRLSSIPIVRTRARRDYWENLIPETGRPTNQTLPKKPN